MSRFADQLSMPTAQRDRLSDGSPNHIVLTKNLHPPSGYQAGPWGDPQGWFYFGGGAANGLNVAGSSALLLTECTFEVWAWTAPGATLNRYGQYYNTAPNEMYFDRQYAADGYYGFFTGTGLPRVTLLPSADGVWHYLAFSIYQEGATWYRQCWADGVSKARDAYASYTATDFGSSAHLARIGSGANGLGDNPLIGALSNLRISTINRYGATAVPGPIPVPAGPFVSDSHTALLIPF